MSPANIGQPSSLQLPSFLHGPLTRVHRKALKEGHRCAEQYREGRPFSTSVAMRDVPPEEVVITHEVADLQREKPAWRLHLVSSVIRGLCEALDWQDSFQVGDAYEAFCRETAWGALYFATSQRAPRSAERMALRLEAVLHFWEPLQSARYLYKRAHEVNTLDGLLTATCDQAMDAWGAAAESPVRMRLQVAAERMARATREDCIEAILRQLPRVLPFARGLKHEEALADPDFWRERLATLEPELFERVSGACTSELLGLLYDWDKELERP